MKIIDIFLTDINKDNAFHLKIEEYENIKSQCPNHIILYFSKDFNNIYELMDDNAHFRLWIHALSDGDFKGFTVIENLVAIYPELRHYTFPIISRMEQDDAGFSKQLKSLESLSIPYKYLNLVRLSAKTYFNIEDYPAKTKKGLKEESKIYPKLQIISQEFGDEYYKNSYPSNISKGEKVLSKLSEYGLVDLSNWGFVSLGGGNGVELLYEAETTKAKFAYLFEYGRAGIKQANKLKERCSRLFELQKLTFEVTEADLYDEAKFADIKTELSKYPVDGLIVSIHAVIHELFTRSNTSTPFIFATFIGRIFDLHEKIFLFIREPGIAEMWPEKVKLKIQEQYLPLFETKARDIILKLNSKFSNSSFSVSESEFISDRDLAIETLTKVFYPDEHEMGEAVTYCSREYLVGTLQATGFTVLESEVMDTDSVYANFKKFGIKAFDMDGLPLSYPKCFTYTIAKKGLEMIN